MRGLECAGRYLCRPCLPQRSSPAKTVGTGSHVEGRCEVTVEVEERLLTAGAGGQGGDVEHQLHHGVWPEGALPDLHRLRPGDPGHLRHDQEETLPCQHSKEAGDRTCWKEQRGGWETNCGGFEDSCQWPGENPAVRTFGWSCSYWRSSLGRPSCLGGLQAAHGAKGHLAAGRSESWSPDQQAFGEYGEEGWVPPCCGNSEGPGRGPGPYKVWSSWSSGATSQPGPELSTAGERIFHSESRC